jgi:hypothetical protein
VPAFTPHDSSLATLGCHRLYDRGGGRTRTYKEMMPLGLSRRTMLAAFLRALPDGDGRR